MKFDRRNTLEGKKGITLIALVITIIVLLILASVSIAMLTGKNGILTQIQNAKIETRGAEVEEQRDLWITNRNIGKKIGAEKLQTREEILDELVSKKYLTNEEKETIEKTGEITIGSRTIKFSDEKTLVEIFNEGKLKVGDYVNYLPNLNVQPVVLTSKETGYMGIAEGEDTNQKYSIDPKTTWRVLGLSEDGNNILLTSGSPLKKDTNLEGIGTETSPYLSLKGSYAYNNCEDILNKICGIYKNDYAKEARSINVEDINKMLGIDVNEEKRIVYKKENHNINIDEWKVLGNEYEVKEGKYNINGKKKEKGEAILVKSNGYYYSYEKSNVIDKNSKLYEILFKGTTSEENYAKSYFLATKGIAANEVQADWGPSRVHGGIVIKCGSLFNSDGYWVTAGMAVRPIISIKSEITENEIEKIDGPVNGEEKWTSSAEIFESGKIEE